MLGAVRARARARLPAPIKWRLTHVRLGYADEENFGDQLSPRLIAALFGVRVTHASFSTADLVSVGSLLESLARSSNHLRPHVWGTGFIEAGGHWDGPEIVPNAVRGELTLERLSNQLEGPVALGDPGLLAPLAFPRAPAPAAAPISVVPHYVDFDDPQVREATEGRSDVRVINVRHDVETVVSQIAGSRLVLSSSLHGLIVADAYGVPNQWTPISERLIGGSYKFEDYYSAFDLSPAPMTLSNAIARADELESAWQPRQRLQSLQQGLLAHSLAHAEPMHLRPNRVLYSLWARVQA